MVLVLRVTLEGPKKVLVLEWWPVKAHSEGNIVGLHGKHVPWRDMPRPYYCAARRPTP